MTEKDCRTQLRAEGWLTPDTYSNSFAPLPTAPGVYLILAVDLCEPRDRKVVYVGKSLDLARRLNNHPVVRGVHSRDGDIFMQRWFREMPAAGITAAEIEAISRFDPPLNIQHRRRDVISQWLEGVR